EVETTLPFLAHHPDITHVHSHVPGYRSSHRQCEVLRVRCCVVRVIRGESRGSVKNRDLPSRQGGAGRPHGHKDWQVAELQHAILCQRGEIAEYGIGCTAAAGYVADAVLDGRGVAARAAIGDLESAAYAGLAL